MPPNIIASPRRNFSGDSAFSANFGCVAMSVCSMPVAALGK
jgi:hypothetical protein